MQKAKLPPRAAVLCGLLFCLLPAARADIQLPGKARTKGERERQKLLRKISPPPTPVDATVRLDLGGHAEIVLRATGALGHTVEFLLRAAPVHGAFEGAPRRLDRDRVAVTYVHRAADGPGHDGFTFAAQAPGTPVSAAGTVDIEVADTAPPSLSVPTNAPDLAATPADLDFGAVETGRSTGVTLTLENRGGGLAAGQLDPPAPWAVDGDAVYRLGPGARQAFRVVFRPAGEGSFAETLRVEVQGGGRTTGCVVRLVGTGLAAAPVRPPATPAVSPALVAVVAAAPSPTPDAVAAPPPPAASAPHDLSAVADPGAITANEAAVAVVEVRAVGSTTLELTWKPPTPLPRSYRVERRSFAQDEQEPDGVRTDWGLCERVDFRIHANEATATVRGLAPGEFVTLRVVSVDTAGRLAPPSPEVEATMAAGSTWWRPTPLKGLGLALAVCLGLLARRRWQENQLVRELDARHDAPEEQPLFPARD